MSDPAAVSCRGVGAIRRRSGGSVYLLVLATAAMVTTIGLSGLMAARLVRASAALQADAVAAESLAAAGLAAAASRLGLDPAYAAAPGDGWSSPIVLGGGVYRTRITADPDAAGRHRVRVRAVVGDSVRVLAAVVREPPRLGPELLQNGGFDTGLHPTRVRGEQDVEVRLRRDEPAVHAQISRRERSSDGLTQEVRGGFATGAVYRLAARVRMPWGSDGVRIGLERRGFSVTTSTHHSARVGSTWERIEADLSPPTGFLATAEEFFVATDGEANDLHVGLISLRRVLDAAPAGVVGGSLAWLPDEPADREMDVNAAPGPPASGADGSAGGA